MDTTVTDSSVQPNQCSCKKTTTTTTTTTKPTIKNHKNETQDLSYDTDWENEVNICCQSQTCH